MPPSFDVVALLEWLAAGAAIGALFGAIWWRPVKRYGIWVVVSAWLLSSLLIGGLAALRASVLMGQSIAPVMVSWSPLNFLLQYAVAIGCALVPVAIALQWRARRRPQSALGGIALSSGAWAVAGLIAMLLVMAALDRNSFLFASSA
jgi:hypothetical protein